MREEEQVFFFLIEIVDLQCCTNFCCTASACYIYNVYMYVCVYMYICVYIYERESCLVAEPCLALCDPMDCSLPGSSVHGISGVGCHLPAPGHLPNPCVSCDGSCECIYIYICVCVCVYICIHTRTYVHSVSLWFIPGY